MPSNESPLVSVAIPLFRSRRFLECIIGNIEALDYANLEVIISDRHCADDAIEILAERFRADPRVRCLKATDQLNWIAHYNFLLRAASGRYFLWMPHDDAYPSDYLAQLVSHLETHPEAVLAYGRLELVRLEDDRPLPWVLHPARPFSENEPGLLRAALRLLLFWSVCVPPFRGVFRREVVVRSGLFIRPTYETVAADEYWVFGLGLKGRLGFVPSCHCTKRVSATGTSAQWGRRRLRHVTNGGGVLCSYIRDLVPRRREACYGMLMIVLWAGLRTIGLYTRRRRWLSEARRRSLRNFLQGLLFSQG